MTKIKFNLLFFTGLLLSCMSFIQLRAAEVDTVETFSPSMNKSIRAVVITPENYEQGTEFPVAYLLHGYSGNYADWISRVPAIREEADRYELIIVCPDGDFSSWYFDSPVDPAVKYETYVASELVSWIDKHYKTIRAPRGRAITGLSMGGHGGLYLGIRHQDVFGAAGSMSGGVDIRPFPDNWNIKEKLGEYAEFPDRWEQHTVINLLHLIKPGSLALIIDCGTEDFFFRVNENLHKKLLERNIPHDYITRPGAHDWDYWRNAVTYQLLYLSRFFKGK